MKHVHKCLWSVSSLLNNHKSHIWESVWWHVCSPRVYSLCCLWLTDPECGDVPLLTPGSKEMMSQALKATFSGFTKEQQRLGIPKGKTFLICYPWSPFLNYIYIKTSACHISAIVEPVPLAESFSARQEASPRLDPWNTFGCRHADWLADWVSATLQECRHWDRLAVKQWVRGTSCWFKPSHLLLSWITNSGLSFLMLFTSVY